MRRLDLDPPFAHRVDKSADDASARKHQCVRAAPLDHGQFEIAVEGLALNSSFACSNVSASAEIGTPSRRGTVPSI
jgi:hypothetical protein